MKQSGVYAILNLRDQRAYIGRSVNIARRWNEHRSRLNRGVHSAIALQEAWNAHGATWFAFVVIDHVEGFADSIASERFFLGSAIEPYNQSQQTTSGPRPGFTRSIETRAKLSAAGRGRAVPMERRARISATLMGRPTGRAPHLGKTFSEETRAKMRAAHLGLKQSEATRAKRSAALTGRVVTPEWKAKISAAKTGVPWSDARRQADKRLVSICNQDTYIG